MYNCEQKNLCGRIDQCGERKCECECEEKLDVCCRPKSDCVDVAVETNTLVVPTCNPCRSEEVVVCYKVWNNGPGTATDILLKSFICPAPNKICVRNVHHDDHFSFKNGIFTFCIKRIKPCECVIIEVVLVECKCENIRDYEIASFVEPKEEDICICNNFEFTGTENQDGCCFW